MAGPVSGCRPALETVPFIRRRKLQALLQLLVRVLAPKNITFLDLASFVPEQGYPQLPWFVIYELAVSVTLHP